MTTITLTPEQSKVLDTCGTDSVSIQTAKGEIVAIVAPPLSGEEVDEMLKRLERMKQGKGTVSHKHIQEMFAFLEDCEERLGRRMNDSELQANLAIWRERRCA